MVDKRRDNLFALRRYSSPGALLLAILLVLGMSGAADYSVVVPVATAFYIATAWALTQKSPFSIEQAFPSVAYLDALAGNLEKMPPEAAFMESCRHFSTQPELLDMLQSVSEGRSLSESMKAASNRFRDSSGIFSIIADLVSFNAGAAADGVRRIAETQREKQRLRAELQEKLNVLSFRNTVLSVIGSASLAIISFSFPLLGIAFTSTSSVPGIAALSFRFDAPAFFSLLSVSLLSTCLSSRLIRGTLPLKSLLLPAAVYFTTYLILVLTMGSSL